MGLHKQRLLQATPAILCLIGIATANVCVQNHVPKFTDWNFKKLFLLLLNVESNVHFWLNTRRTTGSEELKPGDFESIVYSSFDSAKKTKFVIHGWLNSGNNYFSWQIKNGEFTNMHLHENYLRMYLGHHSTLATYVLTVEVFACASFEHPKKTVASGCFLLGFGPNAFPAYLDTHDYNIISVDWSAYSKSLYTIARWSINAIGPYVSKMIDFLIGEFGVSPEDIHLVGHSLGAHIAGLAGEHMKMGNVSRITGLDPAGPLFGGGHYRLDSSDAGFVDVIHTSIRIVGYYPPIGHADFYPNGGGPLQPGCGFDVGFCTHLRSYKYYIESLYDEKGFEARNCQSWHHFLDSKCSNETAFMGEKASHQARGNFYLRTGPSPPFALGPVISNYTRVPYRNSSLGSTSPL